MKIVPVAVNGKDESKTSLRELRVRQFHKLLVELAALTQPVAGRWCETERIPTWRRAGTKDSRPYCVIYESGSRRSPGLSECAARRPLLGLERAGAGWVALRAIRRRRSEKRACSWPIPHSECIVDLTD
jgi:hypothetical protein